MWCILYLVRSAVVEVSVRLVAYVCESGYVKYCVWAAACVYIFPRASTRYRSKEQSHLLSSDKTPNLNIVVELSCVVVMRKKLTRTHVRLI